MRPRHTAPPASALPTATLASLRARASVLKAIRDLFDNRGFIEVETPLLSRDTCIDAWLAPFEVRSPGSDRMFLQTSPEFHMKRLLSAGAERIYQVTRSFRADERGPRHNREFTILEWYVVGDTYVQQMDLVEELIRAVAAAPVGNGDDAGGPTCPSLPAGPFERIRYDDAFARFAGQPVLALDAEELRNLAAAHEVAAPASLRPDDRDGWLNLLLSAVVEPALVRRGAVFLHDYPETQAALARVRDGAPRVAERFELYLNGIEICNGYQELTDADELDRRMQTQADVRRREGKPSLPVRSRLSDAMRDPGLPECAGVALGVDRLVMWRLGAERLDQVIAFPEDRA